VSNQESKNLAASVRQRLLNLSRERREDFNLMLVRYAIERFLFRLSESSVGDQFVLKGATLFAVWSGQLHRPTQDVDLLGYGDPITLLARFAAIFDLPVVDDGLVFDVKTLRAEEIRETQEYGGQRVYLTAHLDAATIPIRIGVGFGDAIFPEATWLSYPTLLSFPSPHLRTYPRESVVAEKLHAMVTLGMLNSRMKDFYDLATLADSFSFDGQTLTQAIEATFRRRQTRIPGVLPIGLTTAFSEQPDKLVQWRAFLSRNRLEEKGGSLEQVMCGLRDFVAPPLQALNNGDIFRASWQLGGPWILAPFNQHD
jgi:predicted nucleotidyltransferase component of viral defense system